jgi:hypothetical protein
MATILFVVEDTFWIKGRGLILVAGVSSSSGDGIRIGLGKL